jgi:hypothetical protein
MGSLHNRNLFSHISGCQKSKMKAPSGLFLLRPFSQASAQSPSPYAFAALPSLCVSVSSHRTPVLLD